MSGGGRAVDNRLGGLLVRRECWTLSRAGKAVLLGALLLVTSLTLRAGYPYLALHRRVEADVLAVEGWISPGLSDSIAKEFRTGGYRLLLIVCNAYERVSESSTDDYFTLKLVHAGVPRARIESLTCPVFDRNRTYGSALSARRWLTKNDAGESSLNVLTVGPHARRSWLTYREVFSDSPAVGVLALRDPKYDPAHWWLYTAGIEEVPWELVGYAYARVFFLWN